MKGDSKPRPRENTVLVTGGAGFVGRHVLKAALAAGHRVLASENRSRIPESLRSQCAKVISAGWEEPAVAAAAKEADAIVHLAAYIPANYEDPAEAEACLQVNALGTLKLACLAAAHDCRFIFVSAANMYAHRATPSIETDAIFPVGRAAFYFVSKLVGECYALTTLEAANGTALVLRVATPYGPGEPASKVVPTFLRLAAKGCALRVDDAGRARFNFVYIDDVAGCIVAAMTDGEAGVYNVGSGESTSLLELAQQVAAAYPEHAISLDIAPPKAQGANGFQSIDASKICKTWGISPIGIAEGLRRYRDNLEMGQHDQ
jgi:UDP-glucose 4-epimerase